MEKATLDKILAIPFWICGFVFFYLSTIALYDGPYDFSYEARLILTLVVPLIISVLIWKGKWPGYLGGLIICALLLASFRPFSGLEGFFFPVIFILPFVATTPLLIYSLLWQKGDKSQKTLKMMIYITGALGIVFLVTVFVNSHKVNTMRAAEYAKEAEAEKAKQEIIASEEKRMMEERLSKFASVYPGYLPDIFVNNSARLYDNDTLLEISYDYADKGRIQGTGRFKLYVRKGYSKSHVLPELEPDAINVSTFRLHDAPAVYFVLPREGRFRDFGSHYGTLMWPYEQHIYWYSGDFYIEAHAYLGQDVLPKDAVLRNS